MTSQCFHAWVPFIDSADPKSYLKIYVSGKINLSTTTRLRAFELVNSQGFLKTSCHTALRRQRLDTEVSCKVPQPTALSFKFACFALKIVNQPLTNIISLNWGEDRSGQSQEVLNDDRTQEVPYFVCMYHFGVLPCLEQFLSKNPRPWATRNYHFHNSSQIERSLLAIIKILQSTVGVQKHLPGT